MLSRLEIVKEVNDAFRSMNREVQVTRRFVFQTEATIEGECVFYLSVTQRPREDRKGGYEMIWKLNGERISGKAAGLILNAYPQMQSV